MSYLSPSLTLLINAVKKASGSLNRDFSEIEQLQSSVKGYKEFVVASYTKVSKALQVELGKIHPDYAWFPRRKSWVRAIVISFRR